MTYSIVARDPVSGALGVAVQSHYFGTGRLVTWAEAGVGAVATQSIVEISYGPHGLDLLRSGSSPGDALAKLVDADPMQMVRQVAVVDASGEVAVHTGTGCVAEAGHRTGSQVSAQANMMAKPTVWDAMIEAYEDAAGEDLAGRMLAALEAAEAEGGDVRGKQSAAVLVVSGERTDAPWDHKLVDLRVDDSPEPLAELRRLIEYNRAFDAMSGVLFSGILFASEVDPAGVELADALTELGRAQELIGANGEPTFWSAVLLAKAGRVEEARKHLDRARQTHEGWAQFLGSLPAAGVLPSDQDLLSRLRG
ncbi:MAG: DUF1028 domain-containing protein [Acidimicrobiales bacterium]